MFLQAPSLWADAVDAPSHCTYIQDLFGERLTYHSFFMPNFNFSCLLWFCHRRLQLRLASADVPRMPASLLRVCRRRERMLGLSMWHAILAMYDIVI